MMPGEGSPPAVPEGAGWEVWRPRYLGLGVMRVRLVHDHMGKRVYLCVEVGGGEREMYLSEESLREWWERGGSEACDGPARDL